MCFYNRFVLRKSAYLSVIIAVLLQSLFCGAAEERISVRSEWGTVSGTYDGSSGLHIVYIQDCHTDIGTQLNIAEIINALSSQYGITLICVEGASKPLDTSYYEAFDDPVRKKLAANYLLKKGLFSGSEYSAINHEGSAYTLIGVEDPDAYIKNLDIYRDIKTNAKQVLSFLNKARSLSESLSKHIYSEDMQCLRALEYQYQSGQISFFHYFDEVMKCAGEAGVMIHAYPVCSLLNGLRSREQELQPEMVDMSVDELIRAISKQDVSSLDIENIQKMRRSFTLGICAEMDYLSAVLNVAEKYQQKGRAYQLILKRRTLIQQWEKINPAELNTQLSALVNATAHAFINADPLSMRLFDMEKRIGALLSVYTLSADRDEYAFLSGMDASYSLENLFEEIESLANAVDAEFSYPEAYADIPLCSALSFYAVASQRDSALVRNTLRELRESGETTAFLIAGGFHNDGITDILRDEDISYTVINPAIGTAGASNRPYEELMLGSIPDMGTIREFLDQTLTAPLINGDMSFRELRNYTEIAFALLYQLELEMINEEGWEGFGQGEINMLAAHIINELSGKPTPQLNRVKTIIHQVFAQWHVRMVTDLLVSALESKDSYTAGHVERVAALAGIIGEEMNLGSKDIEELIYAGLLHDIGKSRIPDTLLNSTNKLSSDEFEKIQQHTVYGSELLSQYEGMQRIAEGAKYHHERMDGLGYPEGLEGQEIPLFARIIGVADTYDTLTSERVYRKKRSVDFAIQVILNASGTQFDPEVVEAFYNAYGRYKDVPGSPFYTNGVKDPAQIAETSGSLDYIQEKKRMSVRDVFSRTICFRSLVDSSL
ncbi:MAG: HD-GYP domain-containing protein [Candidatus Auribacterota bacterium]